MAVGAGVSRWADEIAGVSVCVGEELISWLPPCPVLSLLLGWGGFFTASPCLKPCPPKLLEPLDCCLFKVALDEAHGPLPIDTTRIVGETKDSSSTMCGRSNEAVLRGGFSFFGIWTTS